MGCFRGHPTGRSCPSHLFIAPRDCYPQAVNGASFPDRNSLLLVLGASTVYMKGSSQTQLRPDTLDSFARKHSSLGQTSPHAVSFRPEPLFSFSTKTALHGVCTSYTFENVPGQYFPQNYFRPPRRVRKGVCLFVCGVILVASRRTRNAKVSLSLTAVMHPTIRRVHHPTCAPRE